MKALQKALADAGHHKASKGLLLSALLYAAPDEGHRLEMEYLVPFRRQFPDQEGD